MDTAEVIGEYAVHPAASVFPLIEGDDFFYLVESIRKNGVQHPIVVRQGMLLDGRNRLRACEWLKSQEGWRGVCPVDEWKEDGRIVAEWVWETNALRRHLGDDALALASATIYPLIAAENEARSEASRFKKGESGNPSGTKQVNTKTCSPAKRDTQEMHARSTVGQVAAKAGTSMHKARQAIAVQKAIETGSLPAEAAQEVMTGKKKLRDVVPKPAIKRKENDPIAPKSQRRSTRAIVGDLRDLIAEWLNADHDRQVLKEELKTHIERL